MWIAGARGRDTNLRHEHGGVLGGGLQREAMRRGLIQFGARIRKEVALALPRFRRRAHAPAELPHVAFSQPELVEILQIVNGRALLIGDQALAFWLRYFNVALNGLAPDEEAFGIDFLGNERAVRALNSALGPRGWRTAVVEADARSTHLLTITKEVEGRIKQITFRSQVPGISTQAARQRGAAMAQEGAWVHVLHPLDVLESRLHALVRSEASPTARAIAQTRLAVEIAGRYVEEALAEERLERLEAAAERLQSLAGEKRFEAVLAAHALDLISVLPSNLPEELERLRIKREQENDFEGW